MIPFENREGIKCILREIKNHSKSTKYSICYNLGLTKTLKNKNKFDFDFDFDLAQSFNLIKSHLEKCDIFDITYWTLTEFGEGFLNDRIKPFDEFSEMKSFLLSIKEAIEPQHNVFVNSVILGKAFELGLIKSSKGCWTLTEFGREFLIEVEL